MLLWGVDQRRCYMAGPAEIRGVFTGSWHKELHRIVYGHICSKLHEHVKLQPENHPTLPDHLAYRASQVSVVQALWRKQTTRASRIPNNELSIKRSFHLTNCAPAGVSYRPHRFHTCRQYLCCPFCFYRRLDTLADRLLQQCMEDYRLVATKQALYATHSTFPDRSAITASSVYLQGITNTERFCGGVSFRYLCTDKAGVWCIVLVMLGLVPKDQALQNVKELTWKTYPANMVGIKQALVQHVRYPSAAIKDIPTSEIWNGLNYSLRWMRSGDLVRKGKSANHVYSMQRPTHQATDLDVPAGASLGQLLQLRPSGELQPR